MSSFKRRVNALTQVTKKIRDIGSTMCSFHLLLLLFHFRFPFLVFVPGVHSFHYRYNIGSLDYSSRQNDRRMICCFLFRWVLLFVTQYLILNTLYYHKKRMLNFTKMTKNSQYLLIRFFAENKKKRTQIIPILKPCMDINSGLQYLKKEVEMFKVDKYLWIIVTQQKNL